MSKEIRDLMILSEGLDGKEAAKASQSITKITTEMQKDLYQVVKKLRNKKAQDKWNEIWKALHELEDIILEEDK